MRLPARISRYRLHLFRYTFRYAFRYLFRYCPMPVASALALREICGETTWATLPEGAPQGAFGPRVLSLASTLVADGHTRRRKVVGVLDDVFGLDVSLSTLCEAEQIVSTAVPRVSAYLP